MGCTRSIASTSGAVLLGAVAALTIPTDLSAQTAGTGAFDPSVPSLRITDARLAAALHRVVAGSPTAARVIADLEASGLPVAIGSPRELAMLPDSEGGPAPSERRALLADAGPGQAPPVAWVVFRVGRRAADAPSASPVVERAWVAVDVDSVESWIRSTGTHRANARIQQDLLAILAHEFVAHVGSIARTQRLSDFCDDPPAGARARGESGAGACSLRVENRVRRELNRGLGLAGPDRLPERRSYALDVMNFSAAGPHH